MKQASALLFLLCFSSVACSTAVTTPPTIDAAVLRTTAAVLGTTISRSFSLCAEYITFPQTIQCAYQAYMFEPLTQRFTLDNEAWRNELYIRTGVPYPMIPYYQLTVTGQTFAYFNMGTIVPVADLLASTTCKGRPGYINELLFVMNENSVLTAVPVRGRSLITLTSIPTPSISSCQAFTTHAGVALGYKYYNNPSAYMTDIANSLQGTPANVLISTAGTIEYSDDWSTAQSITSCSGHFRPDIVSFTNLLNYLNDHYGSLNLLSQDDSQNLSTDVALYNSLLGTNPTAATVQNQFKSKIQIRPPDRNMSNSNMASWCFAYPLPPEAPGDGD